MTKDTILVAGATGYLGRYITKELLSRNFKTKIIVRDVSKVQKMEDHVNLDIQQAEVTKPETLHPSIFDNVRIVISTVGITRQKDGLTYMDVDYQANANLIEEAKKCGGGVEKFIYISVLNGDKLRRQVKICEAKERLGDYLKSSGLNYCIIRPTGFFSDMADFLEMAKGGTVYLFGDGKGLLNPIHGEDLARAIVDTMDQHMEDANDNNEIKIGGPDVLSQNEIAKLALEACSKNPNRIVHVPDWIRKFALWIVKTMTSSQTHGPIEFFLTAMALDMQAPTYGTRKLEDYFHEQVSSGSE